MTRLLPIRHEEPPDGAAVVLRAGVMESHSIRRAARRTFDIYAVYGLSVEGVINVTVLEACRSSDRLARYRHIRLSTFGTLRQAGFALLATFDHPHFTLVLPDLAELSIQRLQRCFDEPIPNPARPPSG